MERRDLLRALSAAAAFSIVPRTAEAAWATLRARSAAGAPDALRVLSAKQSALVGAVADTLLPRTDTPGATDIGIQAFVDVIVADHYTDEERTAFLGGLDAIDVQATSAAGAAFADLAPAPRAAVLDLLEHSGDRQRDPAHTYWRLKGLVIHGYFTSERVMKDVLKVVVMPGHYDGAAPMPVRHGGGNG